MKLDEIKLAINSTLGTVDFNPLDVIIKEAFEPKENNDELGGN